MNSLKTNRFDLFVNRAARDKCLFAKFYQPRLMGNPELHLILALIASLERYCLAICLSVSFYLATAKIIGGQVPWKLTRIWYSFRQLLLLPSQQFWLFVHAVLRKVSSILYRPNVCHKLRGNSMTTNEIWPKRKSSFIDFFLFLYLSSETCRLNLNLYFLNQARDETTVVNVSCDLVRNFRYWLLLCQSKDTVRSNLL